MEVHCRLKEGKWNRSPLLQVYVTSVTGYSCHIEVAVIVADHAELFRCNLDGMSVKSL